MSVAWKQYKGPPAHFLTSRFVQMAKGFLGGYSTIMRWKQIAPLT